MRCAHVTTPLEDGSAAARAMTLAMQDAGVAPEEVDYINAMEQAQNTMTYSRREQLSSLLEIVHIKYTSIPRNP